jgi:outer membrane immunogenic protein
MRWVFGALFLLGAASPALAADFDLPPPAEPPANFEILRGAQTVGPATFTRWSGFYVGGQFGLSELGANFANATQSLLAFSLRDTELQADVAPSQWPVLGSTNQASMSYGGFVGYNSQWQDLIVGVEANYYRANFSVHASTTPIARTVSDSSGNAYALDITGTGSMVAEDFGTLRIRAGWVTGNFLPYAFVGMALGVANTAVSATVVGTEYTSGTIGSCTASAPCYPFSYVNSSNFNNAVLYGITAGAGVDVALTANIFLRAEFEWDQFNPPPGFFASIVTGRVGAGFKF